MRVLRISHSAVVGEWRGRERALRARGHEVRLLSARAWDEGGATVPLTPDPGEDVQGVRTFGRHPNLFLYDPRPLWHALGQGWDLVDVHEEPCSLAVAEVLALRALRRVRVPYTLYSAQNIPKRYPPPFRWTERLALRGAGAVSVCNAEAGRILHGKGLDAPAPVIGLGVDVGRFSPSAGRTEAAGPAGTAPVTVGYVGRLAPHKGVDVLLDAVAQDHRLHVRVAGGGPQEAELRARAAAPDLAGRVTFAGHLGQDELADFYRGLDVLAVPSVPTDGWLEQFCRVAVEAMASGVVVVASASGALPEVVGDAGLLVPPGDRTALATALATVRDDPDRAAALRARGLERARDFTWDAVGAAYERMYADVLAAHPTPSVPSATAAPSAPDSAPHVGVQVVVVAYGSAELLRDSLTPLVGHFPLTVIDNSSDRAVRAVATDAGAHYVDPGANLGFAGAVNLALETLAARAADAADPTRPAPPGADVLLLNPDARVSPAAVHALHVALHAAPGVAAVGPAQVDGDGVDSPVLWPFPSPAGSWLQAVGLGGWHGRLPGRGRDERFVIGSVLLLRAQALAEVGAFDDAFFLYSEETDWQRRAHDAGWTSALVPTVHAAHLGGATSSDAARRDTHFHASQERYMRKHFGDRGWTSARVAVLLGSAARSVLPADRGRSARRRLRLYVRGPLRAERSLPGFTRSAPRPASAAGPARPATQPTAATAATTATRVGAS